MFIWYWILKAVILKMKLKHSQIIVFMLIDHLLCIKFKFWIHSHTWWRHLHHVNLNVCFFHCGIMLITKNFPVFMNNFQINHNCIPVNGLFQCFCVFSWTQGARRQWEKQVRSSSSLDELLRLTDFPDWKLWKCRFKPQPLKVQTEASSFPPSVGSHRSTRYAATPFSLEILKGWIVCKSLDVGL